MAAIKYLALYESSWCKTGIWYFKQREITELIFKTFMLTIRTVSMAGVTKTAVSLCIPCRKP